MKIALIGVHGIGKSTTARILSSSLDIPHIEIEAISKAHGLQPELRQALFFAEYLSKYIQAVGRNGAVVIDSHPLIVIPYNNYWLGKVAGKQDLANTFSKAMIDILTNLPKIDLLVEIRPLIIDTVLDRIKTRGRFNLSEEENREYVTFIASQIRHLVIKYGSLIAKEVITIPAEVEAEKRAELIAAKISASRWR